nr:MAG TPA: hypothetical protein [Caudoviricetes sp.]
MRILLQNKSKKVQYFRIFLNLSLVYYRVICYT